MPVRFISYIISAPFEKVVLHLWKHNDTGIWDGLNYALPFAIGNQRIVRIGINFDSATRNIDKTLIASD